MNKDALLATLIGFVIGLIITGIFLLGPNLGKILSTLKLPSFTVSRSGQPPPPTPTPTPEQNTLTIDSPLPDTIEENSSLLVSGSAPPGSIIVIQDNGEETVVVAGADAKFAGTILLEEGSNTITVTSYDRGKAMSKLVTVFYTPEKF